MEQLDKRINDRLYTMMTFLRKSIENLCNSVFESNNAQRQNGHGHMSMLVN